MCGVILWSRIRSSARESAIKEILILAYKLLVNDKGKYTARRGDIK